MRHSREREGGIDVAQNVGQRRTTRVIAISAVWLGACLLLSGGPVTARQTAAPSVPPAGAPAVARPSPFVPPEPLDYANRDGWTSIFDGRTLDGWDGNPEVWSVADGAITAVSSAERRVGSTHLIWRGEELGDFEWKLELKLDGDIHSGIAYRSTTQPFATAGAARAGGTGRAAGTPARGRSGPQVPSNPKWTLYGPGLDFDADLVMAGNVEERGTSRREIAWRGGIVRAEAGKRPRLVGTVGDADALKAFINPGDWNQIHIIAQGNVLTHIINGHVMTVLIDEDQEHFRASGLLGLQIESFGLGRVSVRDVWIRKK
jgi:3-keto-disaccharide hydrolase